MLLSLVISAIPIGVGADARAQPDLRIGLIRDGATGDRLDTQALVRREIEELTSGEFRVEFPPEAQVSGEWTVESIDRAWDRLFALRGLDLVVAIGLIASQRAGARERLPVPVVGMFVVDPRAQGLPFDARRGASSRRNFTYVANPELLEADLGQMKKLFRARRIAYLMTEAFRASVPGLADDVRRTAADLGLELDLIGVDGTDPLSRLPDDVDAVYVGVLPRLSAEAMTALLDGLRARGLPSFVQSGRPAVEAGGLAGIADGIDLPRRARRVALNVQRIALGESAADIPVFITRTKRLVINMATARDIGFWPDWAAMTQAELLERKRTDVERRLTLESAAREALERNLEFLANEQAVEAGAKEIARARARLFLQADAELAGSWIDRDRTASIQNRAERQIDLSLSGRQVLYDDSFYANLTVQKYIQESREYDRETLRLDVLQAATKSYLDVLRTLTLERIQVKNLDLTRSNRELAVVRRSVGVAGPSEVYRWDSQLASDQSAVIDAIAQRNAAEIGLNRVLNHPLEDPFIASEAEMDDPLELLEGSSWARSVENPFTFKVFRSFMSEVGIEASPALQAIDAGISATERQLVAANRAWWLPQFGLEGQVGVIVAQDGNGSEEFDPGVLPPELSLATPDDVSWLVGVNASYPLFTGLERRAEVRQAKLEIQQQRLERQSVALQVEEAVRQSLHIAGASYAAIGLSRESAEAARKNLEVIRDSYAEGTTGYLNLLDAQNQALVAEQVAANAVFDFLSDLMDVQRAINRFVMLEGPAEQDRFEERLKVYFRDADLQLDVPDSR